MRGNASEREARRLLIKKLLEANKIGSQQDLLMALSASGVRVNQSSVSRDLQEMGVVKVRGRYMIGEPFVPDMAPDLREIISSVRSLHQAGTNLLVLHTTQGLAPAIGVALDRASWPEVLGTIAGDDTVFLATSSRREQLIVEARLSQMMG
ncbi:MAG: arginine repressor [Myxococcales bacterium]|jgi:transcriptional regulator of arginine metabolism|nr:arginine repressor [Myxococcales bacterium]